MKFKYNITRYFICSIFIIVFIAYVNILVEDNYIYGDVKQEKKLGKIQNCKDEKSVNMIISDNDEKTSNTLDFNHIKKFDSKGNLLDSWGPKGIKNGEFLHPHGIVSDSKGNIYVSDAILCNVQKFDKNGSVETIIAN